VNRELKEQGVVLYRYVAATDRLFPYKALNKAALSPTGEILSDQWYRALQAHARTLQGDALDPESMSTFRQVDLLAEPPPTAEREEPAMTGIAASLR
jgi:hypothetical protein